MTFRAMSEIFLNELPLKSTSLSSSCRSTLLPAIARTMFAGPCLFNSLIQERNVPKLLCLTNAKNKSLDIKKNLSMTES